jgi:hypothetical protein
MDNWEQKLRFKLEADFRAKAFREQLDEVERLKVLVGTPGVFPKGGICKAIGVYERVLRENPAYARFADLDSPEKPN